MFQRPLFRQKIRLFPSILVHKPSNNNTFNLSTSPRFVLEKENPKLKSERYKNNRNVT